MMREDKHEHVNVTVNERPTADLCGDQRYGGRCIRERDHPGKHLGPNWREDKLVTWE